MQHSVSHYSSLCCGCLLAARSARKEDGTASGFVGICSLQNALRVDGMTRFQILDCEPGSAGSRPLLAQHEGTAMATGQPAWSAAKAASGLRCCALAYNTHLQWQLG